jgi:hypothetical protein
MREMSVTEQRYKAVQGVLADGRTVGEVASQWEVSRRTLHRWRATKPAAWKAWATVLTDRHIALIRCRLRSRF